MTHSDDIVVLGTARTPMGSFQGSLSALSAPELGALAIKAAVERAMLAPEHIEEVIMGCVLQAGIGQGPARQAALQAGLPVATGCTTVNKLCGSAMKAAMLAFDALKAGSIEVALAGGMESMSNAPYLALKARAGLRMGHAELKDHMFLDGLEDAQTGSLMGCFAQNTANEQGIDREAMDSFAIESLKRAQKATNEGWFETEITPACVISRQGEVIVSIDESPSKAKLDKIPLLKPAFSEDGTITAANSSSISDGAAALVLSTANTAKRLGKKPLARILAHATQSQHPSEFTLAPIGAIKSVLKKTGWQVSDVDLFEINEAFAMVAMLPIRQLHLNPEQVNIYGGACALGHPIGATGARLVVTLINALQRSGKRRGIAALCIGGGEATAMSIELIDT